MSDIRAQFQANLFGLIAFTQPFIAHFRTRRTGHILNVSSVGSMKVHPSWSAYSSTKAALDAFTDALHQELKLFGVRVLSVMPGYFSTSFFVNHPNYTDPTEPTKEDPSRVSSVYTDPVTQGYDTINRIPQSHVQKRQIGDPVKYAQRVYEVVTGTGLAKDLVARPTADGNWEGPWEFNRVPVGLNCGTGLRERVDVLRRNVDAFEPIWTSTDVEQERLKYFPRG